MTTHVYIMTTPTKENNMKDKAKPTSIRISASLKKLIEDKAKEEDRSFNNMINRLLEKSVGEVAK